jgi:beta-lactamase regulating signal transducer with metallopeptidase domain
MERVTLEGGLTIVGAWIICRLLPRMAPRTRSWIWRCVYLKLILLLLWQGPIPLPLLPNPSVRVGRAQAIKSLEANPLALPEAPQNLAPRNPTLTPLKPERFGARLSIVALFGVWLAGVGFIALRTVRNVLATCSTLRQGRPLTDEGVNRECEALSRGLRLKRLPRLLTREDVTGPQAVGLWRPVLLFPASFLNQFSPDEVKLVLAHELAHLRRQDLPWGCVRYLVNGLLFFHPLVWVAHLQATLAEEIACDEAAVRGVNAPISLYARTLLKVAAQNRLTLRQAPLVATAMSRTYRMIASRLDALNQVRNLSPRKARRGRWRATVLACAGAVALVQLGLLNWFHASGIRQIDPRYPVLGFKLSRGQNHALSVRREACRFAGFTVSRAFEESVPAQGTPPGGGLSAGPINGTRVPVFGSTIPARVARLLRKLGLNAQLDTGAYNAGIYLPEDSCVIFVRFGFDPHHDDYEAIRAVLEDERGGTVALTPGRGEFSPKAGEYMKFWVISPAPITREKFTLHLRLAGDDKDIAVVSLGEL